MLGVGIDKIIPKAQQHPSGTISIKKRSSHSTVTFFSELKTMAQFEGGGIRGFALGIGVGALAASTLWKLGCFSRQRVIGGGSVANDHLTTSEQTPYSCFLDCRSVLKVLPRLHLSMRRAVVTRKIAIVREYVWRSCNCAEAFSSVCRTNIDSNFCCPCFVTLDMCCSRSTGRLFGCWIPAQKAHANPKKSTTKLERRRTGEVGDNPSQSGQRTLGSVSSLQNVVARARCPVLTRTHLLWMVAWVKPMVCQDQ
jgi:hypothetical protein